MGPADRDALDAMDDGFESHAVARVGFAPSDLDIDAAAAALVLLLVRSRQRHTNSQQKTDEFAQRWHAARRRALNAGEPLLNLWLRCEPESNLPTAAAQRFGVGWDGDAR